MVTIPFGDFDAAAQEVRATVLRMEELERYLVYGQYELVPSATADLPVDPQEARLSELARQHPEGIGRWVVLDRDGNVIDELGPLAVDALARLTRARTCRDPRRNALT